MTRNVPEKNARVMIVVDDDIMLRNTIEYTLEEAGFHVVEADSAVEALKIMRVHIPHGVITDVNMPGGSGIMLLTEMKRRERCVPTYIHSANQRFLLNEGVWIVLGDYIPKHFGSFATFWDKADPKMLKNILRFANSLL